MTTQGLHVSAHCEDCGKQYRVANPDRTYACKACGGTVRAEAGAEPHADPVIEGTVTCTECDAVNPGGTHYCAECGTTLAVSTSVRGSNAAARLRQEAADAFKGANRTIGAVTVMYRFGALAYAIATVFAIMALARTDVPRNPGILVVVLTTLLSVMLLMGALHIHFKPFLWTVAIAVLATVVSVVHLVGPNPFGIAFIASASWAALAWAALVPTFRFNRLIATHRDLYVTHHASAQTRRSLKGRSAHERHERLMMAMRRAARRAWRVSSAAAAGILLASAAGTWFVLTTERPADFVPVLERFQSAWNAGDFAAVDGLFEPRVREAESARLEGRLLGYGWKETPPTLTERSRRETPGQVDVDYEFAGLTITARWSRVGPDWWLVRFDIPLPPFEPTFERFVGAWEDSDPDRIIDFFAPEAQAEMRAGVEKAVRDRGWGNFPEILDTETTTDAAGQVTVVIKLPKGKVTTEWHFRTDGQWHLHGLKFPKR